MKKTPNQIMEILNKRLEEFGQELRIEDYQANSLKLSTGVTLHDKDKRIFYRRINNKKTDIWIKNIDALLSGSMTEKEIRSKLSSIGGNAVQLLYGKKIRKNLNTGVPWNAGTKGQNLGNGRPHSLETKNKISAKNSGSGNGMYGKKQTEESKQKKSTVMKAKILAGEFTPNSNNRNTHWESLFNGKKYRSSWEALYQYFNPDAEYEKLRIEYTFKNNLKVYVVDFVDHNKKTVTEVKPKSLCVGGKFLAKKIALESWANKQKYSMIIADETWFQEQTQQIDYSKFDENTIRKIKKLYENNQKNRDRTSN